MTLEQKADAMEAACRYVNKSLPKFKFKNGFEIKKDFYKEAKKWEEEVIQANKDIEEFGFTKTLLQNQSLTLF